jgi:hypothetical protein
VAGRIYMKQGDTEPPVDATLCDRNGPVDLTGTTVNFIMKFPTGSVKVNAPATIIDAVNGVVKYSWGPTDTDTPGMLRSEFQVSLVGGKIVTFPNNDYIPTDIQEQLA